MGRNVVGRRTLVTAPSSEPVTVSELKEHTRVEISADDTLLQNQIVAARKHLESETNRAFVTQTWKLVLDEFPGGDEPIVVPKPPLQSVSSVKYTPEDSAEATFASSNYIVDTDSEPGRIAVKRDQSWRTDNLQAVAGVAVEFVAGYGDPSAVPQQLKQAIMLLAAHWYEHREAVMTRHVPREVQRALGDLVDMSRVRMLA